MFLLLLFIGAFAIPVPPCSRRPPPTVSSYNLTQYLGKWYQIADLPQPYEVTCNVCTRADYGTKSDGNVSVHNTGNEVSVDGPRCGVYGYAIPKRTDPAKLTVVFYDIVPKDTNYWIMSLGPVVDEQYSYALVSQASRESCYILNRQPTMDQATLADCLQFLTTNGFDVTKLKYTIQDGCTYPA
eukprot:TRINITY_DN1068_c0_g1_i8.p1 TRINITY_DN1068_c0_g1~~TRINITY_DN1068_c0_g1_i8.p1  ORF type:complete len:184 (+),score=3.43 TRINITY_DN1068_c0_g1_i8:51-602(+)